MMRDHLIPTDDATPSFVLMMFNDIYSKTEKFISFQCFTSLESGNVTHLSPASDYFTIPSIDTIFNKI